MKINLPSLAISLLLLCSAAFGQDAATEGKPSVRELGNGRYQVGPIIVDRNKNEFSVPGRMLRDEPPLEYLAVTVGGMKGYESLLELDANAFEFNLACILIGLDKSQVERMPEFQFDTTEIEAPQVRIHGEWEEDGETMRLSGAEMMTVDGEPLTDNTWVYLGSFTPPPPAMYAAQDFGTLIGFVHDPASIIDHSKGIGIGAYGEIDANYKVLPKVGAPVTLIIGRVTEE